MTSVGKAIWRWLVTDWNWPGAAAFCGVAMLLTAPVFVREGSGGIFWIWLQIPLYMLHQFEEHSGDRFRMFVNTVLGGGVEVLSRPATFWINSLGVWGVDLLALILAVFIHPGWGLMALYLPLVNAVGHVGQAIALKRYNPGLVTAIVLFVPFAGCGLIEVSRLASTTLPMQITGFLVAVGVHAAIIVHVKSKLRQANVR